MMKFVERRQPNEIFAKIGRFHGFFAGGGYLFEM
jgi:hypothetical protein